MLCFEDINYVIKNFKQYSTFLKPYHLIIPYIIRLKYLQAMIYANVLNSIQ